MPISYQKLFTLLDEKGWTTYKIRKEKLMGQGTLTALKKGTGGLDSKTIARICGFLDCQPGDIMEYKLPARVEKRIIELTELEEEKLTDYYRDKWENDDSEQVRLDESYREQFQSRLEAEEEDTEFLHILETVVQKYSISALSDRKSWRKIEKQYPDDIVEQLHENLDSVIDEYIEAIENAENDFIQSNVKMELEAKKSEIQCAALKEYLDNPEE